jgi:RNA ligase
MNYLTLDKCLEYADLGWLDKHESADGKLVGFKYSRQTVYDGAWDEITLQCRGIVFDKSTGDIIAHPFNKFFNYEEIYDVTTNDGYMRLTKLGETLTRLGHEFEPRITKNFRAMDKLDGSLGILFYYEDKWIIKTAGSFDSDQAKWAQNWFDTKIDDDRKELHLDKDWTYCFEIISNEDPHVCHYDYEGLVLLGFFDENQTEGEMADIAELAYKLDIRYSQMIYFDSMEKMIEQAKKLDVDHEGFVVTFSSGFKMKIKGVEYLEKFKMLYSISKKSIRENFDTEHLVLDPEYRKQIPEELWEIREYADRLEKTCEDIKLRALAAYSQITGMEGRERYEMAVEILGKRYACLAINLVTGRKINDLVFRFAVEELKSQGEEDE